MVEKFSISTATDFSARVIAKVQFESRATTAPTGLELEQSNSSEGLASWRN